MCFCGTDEFSDTRTHNDANEILTRGAPSATLVHDKAGQMTDDNAHYKYKYDAFGRLVEIKNQSSVLVAEYVYDGLGQRIGWHYDSAINGVIDSSDPWYRFIYDDRWRIAAGQRTTSLKYPTSHPSE